MISVLRHCLLLLCFFTSAVYAWQPQQGDIIFHTSRSSQSIAIQKATGSVYSHMGIILLRDGKPYVYEAAKTVRFTPLKQWIARGTGNHYVVKRLKNQLSASQQQALYREAIRYQSRPYVFLCSPSADFRVQTDTYREMGRFIALRCHRTVNPRTFGTHHCFITVIRHIGH